MDGSFDFASLRARLESGATTAVAVADAVLDRIAAAGDDRVWIHRPPDDELRDRAAALDARHAAGEAMPLYGLPFAVKDNIDVAGWPTTAGCPEFAYTPEHSATVVDRLTDAGALPVGKTNLDQFATGLVGVRSPYGTSRNPFDPRFIPGGSSSGSAVAVASGLVSFALGTDTAGSGRVPAAFNNIVGLKPTRGALSTSGVVPACRSLDCGSIFALCAGDAAAVFDVAAAFDAADPFSRRRLPATIEGDPAGLRFAVPRAADLEFFGDAAAERIFSDAVARLEALGARPIEVDISPLLEVARLLYEGPWVAERYAAIAEFIEARRGAMHPITRQIIEAGAAPSAVDAFRAFYRLRQLARDVAPMWDDAEILMTPTAATIYTVAEIESDPVGRNGNLGYYTNFMNLLDLCGVAVPAGFRDDGLPLGVTLAAPAGNDAMLCRLADALHRAAGVTLGATGAALPPPGAFDDTGAPVPGRWPTGRR